MSERTVLHKGRMPRWIWQLRIKGFHVQQKKYLHFLWRQRPAGCNWSRQLRAKYFNRCIRTITRWDAFLVKWHLAWYSGKGSMEHRIGARPYYRRLVWERKCFGPKSPKARDTNVPPYTAQQKNSDKYYSSSACAAAQPTSEQAVVAEPAVPREYSSQGADPPAPPCGSRGARSKVQLRTRTRIRAKIVRHSRPLPAGDWEAKMHELPWIDEKVGIVEQFKQNGMSEAAAVRAALGKDYCEVRKKGTS